MLLQEPKIHLLLLVHNTPSCEQRHLGYFQDVYQYEQCFENFFSFLQMEIQDHTTWECSALQVNACFPKSGCINLPSPAVDKISKPLTFSPTFGFVTHLNFPQSKYLYKVIAHCSLTILPRLNTFLYLTTILVNFSVTCLLSFVHL